jgi:signal transduction histidine kinase/HPt (histidine-containing phosphotransfer) domain-containing protein/ActR/RegA family two-component response regulator
MSQRCRILLVLLLFCGCQSVFAAIAVNDLDQPVPITQSWQFKAGDDLLWAAPELDDSGWHTVESLSSRPESHEEDAGLGWYRLTIQLDLGETAVQRQLGALAVSIGGVDSAYEIFAGGQKLGGVGALPPNPRVTYDRYQVYSIPSSAIDNEGRLVLALRNWRAPGGWNSGAYQGPFKLGNVGDLRSSAIYQALVPNILLAVLYLAIGLYHLLIARRNPAMREFFWFGWFAIALAFYCFETSQLKFSLEIPYLLHKKIEYFALYMVPFLFIEIITRVIGIRLNWAGRAYQYLFLVYAVLVVAVPNFDIFYFTLPSFQILAALSLLGTAILTARKAWRGSRRARVIFALMLFAFFAVFNYITADTSVQSSTYLLHFAFALMILIMAVLMANNYTATLAKLEHSVEERTEDLQQTNRELEAAVAVRSQFLANMSHELRTPMNAIIGLTHMSLKTELSEQQRDYLTTVEQSAQGLGGIIEGIFDFSRLEEGSLECVLEPFSLPKVIANLAAIYRPQAETKGLKISFSQDPRIPEQLVGDAARLGQILGHFTSNAVKFTGEGEVRFSVRLLEQNDDQLMLEFVVQDTGPGLTPEQRAHLFESFRQVDTTNTRAHGGTGLGLAISQALAQLMGGVIEVEGEPGAGSTFRLRLSLAVASNVDSSGPTDDGQPAELDLTPIHGAQVLLVDDSEINLQVASALLSQAHLHVDLAHDGQEAVDRVKDKHYDCVLMDIQMPVMDGYTATETIRAIEGMGSLPILAMTANVLPEDRARAKEAGLDDHIPKPIDPQALYRKLLHWIEPGQRTPFEATLEAEVSVPELPQQLPGIAISDGMSRVGGNTKLYVKLLSDLRADYATAAGIIEQLFREGNIDGASQLAHKLRGIANNLGATEVGSNAEQVEQALKDQGAADDELFVALASSLSILIDSIGQLEQLTTSTAGSSQLTDSDIQHLLTQLEQEIADSNPGAEDTVEQLVQGMGEDAQLYPTVAAIRDAIDIYDFATAGEQLALARQGSVV